MWVLFTDYTIGYAVTQKALNKVHDIDIRDNDRFLVIDFELAEQFLIPKKRRDGNRFSRKCDSGYDCGRRNHEASEGRW